MAVGVGVVDEELPSQTGPLVRSSGSMGGSGSIGGYGAMHRRRTTSALCAGEVPEGLEDTAFAKLRDGVAAGITAYGSPLNTLMLFLPLGFLGGWFEWNAIAVFCCNFAGMIPLAMVLGRATEDIGEHTNQTIGPCFISTRMKQRCL